MKNEQVNDGSAETTGDAFRWRHLLRDTYQGDGWKMLICEGLVLGAVADWRGLVALGVIYRDTAGQIRVIDRRTWGNVQHYRKYQRKTYQETKTYLRYTNPEEVKGLVYFVTEWLPALMEMAHLEMDAERLQELLLAEVPVRARPRVQRQEWRQVRHLNRVALT